MNDKDPNQVWVRSVYGRILRLANHDSGVIAHAASKSGAGLMLTALHVAGSSPASKAAVPEHQGLGPNSIFVGMSGYASSGDRIARHGRKIYSPAVPAKEWSPKFVDLNPEQDFAAAIVAGPASKSSQPWQRGNDWASDAQKYAPLDALDPTNLTSSENAVGEAVLGEPAIAVGHTANIVGSPMVYSTGKILAPAEYQALKEHNEPYDPRQVFAVQTAGGPGMSGGGVFDKHGRLIGIIVRANSKATLAVRATYALDVTNHRLASLPEDKLKELRPHLGPRQMKAIEAYRAMPLK